MRLLFFLLRPWCTRSSMSTRLNPFFVYFSFIFPQFYPSSLFFKFLNDFFLYFHPEIFGLFLIGLLIYIFVFALYGFIVTSCYFIGAWFYVYLLFFLFFFIVQFLFLLIESTRSHGVNLHIIYLFYNRKHISSTYLFIFVEKNWSIPQRSAN